jgi:hypothetical protein
MMWWWRLLFFSALLSCGLSSLLLLAPVRCDARVVINEVYYDHPGLDDGWEFVELYNTAQTPCDLSGWRLEFIDGATGRVSVLWTASAGTVIEPDGLICVAGSARGSAPELRLTVAIGNGPDAVRLVSSAGVVDLVGYGEVPLAGLYESYPACDVDPGLSLARKPDGADSNRNGADFVAAYPSPNRRNFFSSDLGIALQGASLHPCRGSPFSFVVRLTNEGIERTSGRVTVVASALEGGCAVSSERSDLDLDLLPETAESVEVRLLAPLGGRFELWATVLDETDENASNDTVRVPLASSPGDIVVNEIMYRPAEGMSEWMELENRSAAPRNLNSWTVRDATGAARLMAAEDLVVEPGSFLILVRDSSSFRRQYRDCRAEVRRVAGGWPTLNDTGKGGVADVVELRDGDGVLVERIDYKDLLGSERGRSLERVSEELCSSTGGGLWHRCTDRSGATPGRENSIRTDRASQGRSSISPNPFCPRRDREMVITVGLAEGETGFLVRIYDLEGIEIRRLFGERGGAHVLSCRWDGRTNDGSPVPTGLYVCLVEFIGSGGGAWRKEKQCVAVASD